MKKFIYTIVAIAISATVTAQNSNVVNAYNEMGDGNYEKAAEYIDKAIEHEKTMNNAKTWVYRGQIYMGLAMTKLAPTNMYDVSFTDEGGTVNEETGLTIMWTYSFEGKAGQGVQVSATGIDAYAGIMLGDEVAFEARNADGTAEASGTLSADGNVTYLIVDPAKAEEAANDMMTSIDSYIRGAELDDKDRYEREIAMGLNMSQIQMFNTGVGAYNLGEYEMSFEAFSTAVRIGDAMGVVDTLSLYNMGLAGAKCGKNQDALDAFNRCIEYNYIPAGQGEVADLYIMVAQIHDRSGDNAKALEVIKEGRAAFPDSEMLIREELNIYLLSGDNAGAEQSLAAALEKDPDNPMYYYAMGVVYNDMANPTQEVTEENTVPTGCMCNDDSKINIPDQAACDDRDGFKEYIYAEVGDIVDLPWPDNHDELIGKAVTAYTNALNINPDYLDALFNLGAMYMNEGVALYQSIQTIPDAVMRKDVQTKAKEYFCLALPHMESALRINQDDPGTLQSLKTIYGQLNMLERYQVISDKVKNATPIDYNNLMSLDTENDCNK